MMKRTGAARLLILLGTAFLWHGAGESIAFAQEEDTAPSTTVTEAAEVTAGLYDRAWTVTPRIGVLGFQEPGLNHAGRIVEGFTTNVSLGNIVGFMPSMHVGLESGVLFSHIGSPGANLFGVNAPIQIAEGSNTVLVPLNATVGYRPLDRLLVAANLGASLVHRSIGNTMRLGRAGDSVPGSATELFPNVGLNLGYAVSNNVGVSLRGDWVLTPATNLFTASIGAQFAIA
jgi:hypothetical protein